MSGKKAREARREQREGLLVTLSVVVEWNGGGADACNVCKKHFEHCVKVTLYDAYDTNPEVLEPLRGTTAGELQIEEHMLRVMRRQTVGYFTASLTRPYCAEHAMELVSHWMGNTAHGTMAALTGMITGRDTFTVLLLYAERGAWAPTVPSMANGIGTPNLPAIYQEARRHHPNTNGPNKPGIYFMNVDD